MNIKTLQTYKYESEYKKIEKQLICDLIGVREYLVCFHSVQESPITIILL